MDRFISYLRYICGRLTRKRGLTRALNEIQTKNSTNGNKVFVEYVGKSRMHNIEDVAIHDCHVYFLDKKLDQNRQPNIKLPLLRTKIIFVRLIKQALKLHDGA